MPAFWHGIPAPINHGGAASDLLTSPRQPSRMRIEKRTMNWLPRPSLHEEADAARLKRRENARA